MEPTHDKFKVCQISMVLNCKFELSFVFFKNQFILCFCLRFWYDEPCMLAVLLYGHFLK